MNAPALSNAIRRLLAPPPAAVTPEQAATILVLSRAGHRLVEIARTTGLPRAVVVRIIRENPPPPPPARRGLGPDTWELKR